MSEGPLSPEEVAHRGFGVSFRGFDTTEVRAYLQRVANELRTGTARERELHRRLADAEHRAANPVIEGEILTRAMGEEMARVLASAQHAANGLKEKAEENAARILREAHEQAQRIRAQAEAILAVRTDEANVEAAGIRRAAEGETEALLERARAEAAAAITEMQDRARQMVQDAQATRARVLGDLARRRRLLQTQVEQLRAGRDRLLDAYRLVRSTTDDVADELQRVEDEARRAAGAAGERMAAEPVPDELDDVLHAFSGAEPVGAPAATAHSDETTTSPPGEAAAPAPADPAAQIAAVLDDHVADETAVAATAAADADRAAPRPGERRPLRLLRRPKEATRPLDTAPAPVPDEEVRVVARPPAPAEPEEQPAGEPPVEATPASSDEPAATAAPDAVTDEPAAPAPDGPAPDASVEELFARIRAGRAEAVAKAREVLAGAEDDEGGDEPAAGRDAPASIDLRSADLAEAVAGPPGDESLLRRRDAAVGEIESRLARRLKRALQDEQNEVLDRLRSARAGAGATDVLPSPADQAARYASAATELLREAAGAGRSFVGAGGAGGPAPAVDEVAGELASWLAEPLRRALDRAFESDRSDPSLVFERIGAAYRECKAQRIEGLAGDAVTAAFGLGTLSALPSGAEARWVVDDDGRPCPDCDDNALAGPTAAGEPFPTGQSHPPAHAGCRCLLASVRLAAAVPDAG